MFASSRVDKGKGQFKPLVKPRNPRASVTPAITNTDSSQPDQLSTPAKYVSQSAFGIQPGPSTLTAVNSSFGEADWETEGMFSSRDERPETRQTPTLNNEFVPSRGASIVPSRGPSVAPQRAASIVPTRSASIVPTRSTSIAPSRTHAFHILSTSKSSHLIKPATTSSVSTTQTAGLTLSSTPVAPDGIDQSGEPGPSEGPAALGTQQSKSKGKKKATPLIRVPRAKRSAVSTDAEEDHLTKVRSLRPRKAVIAVIAEAGISTGESTPIEDVDGEYDTTDGADAPKKRTKRTPRKRKEPPSEEASQDGDGADDDGTTWASGGRKRKRTALELVPDEEIPVDEDGNPFVLDPEVVTMAELCMDLGVGRPSSRTEESVMKSFEWKQKQRTIRAQVRERQKAKFAPPRPQTAAAEGEVEKDPDVDAEPVEEEAEGDGEVSAATRRLQEAEGSTELAAQAQSEQTRDVDLATLKANKYSAQVRVDENGEIIMDDLSLTVDRYEAARAEVAPEDYELVEEAERDRFVNSATWSKKISGSRWTREETDLFYHYCGMWGTDFEMIAHLMPGRTRKEIRNKYNAEARKDPARLDGALARKVPIDLDELSKATGLDFSGPIPDYGAKPETASAEAGEGGEYIDINVPDRPSASPPPFDEAFRSGASGDEQSLRASPTPAVSRTPSTAPQSKPVAKGKNAKTKQKQKKSKKRGATLADDEEIIGVIPMD